MGCGDSQADRCLRLFATDGEGGLVAKENLEAGDEIFKAVAGGYRFEGKAWAVVGYIQMDEAGFESGGDLNRTTLLALRDYMLD
jgi:hypothetical protein